MGKKCSLIIPFIIIIISCSSNYNKPFINSDETTRLSFGMSQDEVVKILGDPLFVESGGDGKVVYVYEVRTILVKSNLTTSQPKKYNIEQKHDSPVHELKLEFQNGELKFWKNYQEGAN